MPRRGAEAGYDPMNVCAFCIEFLTITAAGKGMLKTMPLGKLKKYLEAYNIATDRAVEKDDLIDSILRARKHNGCLSPDHENYYRRYSVPDKSTSHRSRLFSRPGQSSSTTTPPPPPPNNSRPMPHFARPDLAPDPPPHQRYQPPPGAPPPPHQTHPSYPPPPPVPPRPQYQPPPQQQQYYHHQQQYHQQGYGYQYPSPPPPPPPQAPRPTGYPQYQRPSAARSSENLHNAQTTTPPRQRATSANPPPPPAPTPTLEQLLDMSDNAVKALSIGTLKSILFINHVNAGMILEKGDLVAKVKVLVEDERRERARQRAIEEQEEEERIERQRVMMEEHRMQQRERDEREARARANVEREANDEGDVRIDGEDATQTQDGEKVPEPSSTTASHPPPKIPPKTLGTVADLERTGLCVICQDDEANIAIVDCGYVVCTR
ncbi:hypothetical protein H0H87_012370 [Tephrocybe sp. NHM501043]|nr:hypothetical protein H0H87_012370 [Tephrocybe sp. NHM501043]